MKKYFDETPPEQLKKDWEELKKYNEAGSDITDVIQPSQLLLFCIKANINWLQYEILCTALSVFRPETVEILESLITIGVKNKIYNGVPRIGQGNKVIDIADYIKKDFKKLFPNGDTLSETVKHCLMGEYGVALKLLKSITS